MRRTMQWLIILGFVVYFGSALAAERVGAKMNGVRRTGPYRVGEAAAALHARSAVVDLHADALLWDRDLLERSAWGHVDLPRLVDGNVALQVLGVVTKTPVDMNYERNTAETDRVRQLIIAQKWPLATWSSLMERALYQAKLLEGYAERSPGRLMILRRRADLDALLARRRAGEKVVGALLGLEGCHALEGRAENLGRLADAGLRMLGLAHFFDNEFAGSAHGVDKQGLGDAGRRLVADAERRGITIDLAHASPAVFAETLKVARHPVVVSHSGVQGTCPGPRNLDDAQLRALAANGGVVGIGLFEGAVCGPDVADTVRAIVYAANVAGVEHVALGSDFDGAILAPIDAGGLALITEGLLEQGMSPADIEKILGLNALRVLAANLPN